MDRRLDQVLTARTPLRDRLGAGHPPGGGPWHHVQDLRRRGTDPAARRLAGAQDAQGPVRLRPGAAGSVPGGLRASVVDIELHLGTGGARITVPRDAVVDVEGLRTGWKDSDYKTRRRPAPAGRTIRISGTMGFGRLRIRHCVALSAQATVAEMVSVYAGELDRYAASTYTVLSWQVSGSERGAGLAGVDALRLGQAGAPAVDLVAVGAVAHGPGLPEDPVAAGNDRVGDDHAEGAGGGVAGLTDVGLALVLVGVGRARPPTRRSLRAARRRSTGCSSLPRAPVGPGLRTAMR